MNRRNFFKPLVAGGVSAVIFRDGAGAEVRHAAEVPVTPFDEPEGTWTLAVFPDTQNLTKSAPEVFVRQAEWVAAHKESHGIRFVAHLGDITDNNLPEQWENAKRAMDVLKGAGVPYSLVPGNHDYSEGGRCVDRTTGLNGAFGPGDYVNSGKVGYFEEGKLENTVHAIETPSGGVLVVAMEFGPREEVLEWVNREVAAHPEHLVVVTTHAYLYSDSTRYDFARHGPGQTWNPHTYGVAKVSTVHDGEEIWRKVVSRHANVRFVLNGHVLHGGAGRLASEGAEGRVVHQLLSNYQMGVRPKRPFHGGGYFRLMRFLPDGKTVKVKTYSPWLDDWLTEDSQQFELKL